MEICLLGNTLGVVIQVIPPSQVDKDDFIAYYPSLDDASMYTPVVTLVAEDDRHYNIVMQIDLSSTGTVYQFSAVTTN